MAIDLNHTIVAARLLRLATGFRLSRRTARLVAICVLSIAGPCAILVGVNRGAAVVVALVLLIAATALLSGRLLGSSPTRLSLIAAWVDARLLGPTSPTLRS